MQGFPFDSQLSYDPETGDPIYDRAVSSQPLRKLLRELFTTGIMPNPSTNLQVSAGTDGMTVQVNTGFAVIDGGLCQETEVRTLEVTAADNTYDRIDTVVLRWNENVDVRTADLYVVAGTPAASPVRPELQRDNSIYEIGLADVFVTKRVATITNDKITDTRYEAERCGVVRSISEYDTTYIYQQVQADLAGFKNDEETAFSTWSTEQKAAFEAWVATIQDILDENTAGHLQNEIDALTAKVVAEPVTADSFELLGTFEGSALAHIIYGMSEQDGTPTPDNPVDIVSAEANFKCVGKNLIPYPYANTAKTDAGVTFTPNVDGSISIEGTSTSTSYFTLKTSTLDFKPNTEYTISLDVVGTGKANIFIQKASGDLVAIRSASAGHTEVDFTTGSAEDIATYRQVGIYIYSGHGAANLVVCPMVRLKDASQDYEPYHEYEADTDLVLRAIEVSSTDDYNLVHGGKYYVADTIEWSEDEGYKLIRRIASVDLGDYTYGYQPSNTYFYASFNNVKKSPFTKIIEACEGFTPSMSSMAQMPMNCVRLQAENSNVFNFKYNEITDPTAFKTLVTGMKLQYIMETPTVTALTNAQAKALLGLQTYNGATLIESTADVAPVVKLEHGRTQNEAYALTGHNVAKSDKLNLTANDGLEFQFASSNGEHGYLDENGVFKAFKTTHTETKTINTVGTTDMGEDHKYRYVETEGLMAIPTAKKTITANGNNQDVLNYEKADIQVPPHYKLVGTYSSNTSVNVSAYGATSAGQFVLVPIANQSAHFVQTGDTRKVDWPAGYARFYVGSLSLSGSTLSVTLPSVRVEVFTGDSPWPSATSYIQCRLYFVGNAS